MIDQDVKILLGMLVSEGVIKSESESRLARKVVLSVDRCGSAA